jgi:hypothetical protein
MEEVVYKSSDGIVSIVQSEAKQKLTPDQAGFIRPRQYLSKKIEKDRFCCGNCVRYIKKTSLCHIVDIEDIDPRDCCNDFLDAQSFEEQANKQMALLPDQQSEDGIYIESGAASSQEKNGIVNGIAYAKIDESRIASKVNLPKRGTKSSRRHRMRTDEHEDDNESICVIM